MSNGAGRDFVIYANSSYSIEVNTKKHAECIAQDKEFHNSLYVFFTLICMQYEISEGETKEVKLDSQ